MWACRGLQSQGTSITEFSPPGPCGGWSGCLLARASFFRPWCLPCLVLHPISSLLMHGTCSFSPCASASLSPLSPSLGFCSLVCSMCGVLLLIRWLPCLVCGKQSCCTSETLEAEWSLKAQSLSAGECF